MEGISHAVYMSIMTFRQKVIRISASAAICGLSISFTLGEMIDQKATMLTAWKNDAHFFPASYSPLKPLFASKKLLSSEGWKQSLIALNSANTESVVTDKLAFKLAAPKLSPIYKEGAALEIGVIRTKVPMAAAKPSVLESNSADTAKTSTTLKEVREEVAARREVDKVMLSIHDATASLQPSPNIKISVPYSEVIIGEAPVKKSANEEVIMGETTAIPLAPFASVKKAQVTASYDVPMPPNAPATPVAPPSRNPKTPPEMMLMNAPKDSAKNEEVWQIQGKILFSKQDSIPPGHFEVGIYSKIDSEGLPIGAPLIQQMLPTGKVDFRLSVPKKMDRTFLFGEFVADKGGKRTLISPPLNPIEKGSKNIHFAELNFRATDSIATIASASMQTEISSNTWRVRGKVTTMFVKTGSPAISQEDVVVKLRGRKESARTDKNGEFSLELPKLKGEVALEFLKAGYHPSIHWVKYPNKSDLRVDLASRDAVEKIARNFNSHQITSKGVFIGKSAPGLAVQMSLKAEGPFYFGENGFPDSKLKATSSDGRFIFFNIEPGIGFLEATIAGENIAPISISVVEGGQLIFKNLNVIQGKIKGRAFNPVATNNGMLPINGARLRIEGASEWSNTDSYGAFVLGPMKFFQSERVAIELTAEKFLNHRYVISSNYIEEKNELNLFAFSSSYVNKLGNSMDVMQDSYAGIILGKVSNLSVRIDAMAEHSVANGSKDFYFDAKGRLQGAHAMTDPRYGTFMIFNVPKGNTLLHGNNSMGQLQFYDSVASYPATISVVME